MSLAAGARVGHYQVTSLIGQGGMGEVYRAQDTRLKREVALKLLPDSFAADPDRLARFQREAEVLASLNHPHIAQIYGLEESVHDAGHRVLAIAMELVEGETLADRIARGAVPLDEALAIARQIVEALEAAHDKGVVHRDLKPANIKVTPSGDAKVLDFGLAKALEPPSVAAAAGVWTQAATMTSPAMTQAGVILGTAAYMSPEQARGKPVDKRADIWAFGCVLHEMVTGKPPFAGETVTDVLAAVVTSEPDSASVPPRLRRVIAACMRKDPRQRLRDIGDVWTLLDTEGAEPAAAVGVRGQSRWAMAAATLAAVAIVALAALAFVHFREQPAPREPLRLQVALPRGATPGLNLSISPDGRHIAFIGWSPDNVPRVWVRSLDGVEARAVAGSEGPGTGSLFWSFDSRWLAFAAGGRLQRVDVIDGGSPQTITNLAPGVIGAAWNADGTIVFGTNVGGRLGGGGGMFRVSSSGGPPVRITALDQERQEFGHRFPSFLPDGRRFLYLRSSFDPEQSGIFVASIDDTPDSAPSERLLPALAGPAHFVRPAGDDSSMGSLVFLRGSTLVAQPFDSATLKFTGEALTVAEPVGTFLDRAIFWSSRDGTIVYTTAPDINQSQLTWFDAASGKPAGTVGDMAAWSGVAVSPDGKRVAAVRAEFATGLSQDVWMLDVLRGTQSRFTFGPGRSRFPVWSSDGAYLAFMTESGRRFTLSRRRADGSGGAEVVLESNELVEPSSWSPDGKLLLYHSFGEASRSDVFALPVSGDRKPFPLVQTPPDERDGQVSPDGRWLAYVSREGNRRDVHVRPFTNQPPTPGSPSDAQWVVATGAENPRWLAGGSLSFVTSAGDLTEERLTVVDVVDGSVFQWGPPRQLSVIPSASSARDVTRDGKRLLVGMGTQSTATPPPLNIVMHWLEAPPQ